MEEHVTNLAY